MLTLLGIDNNSMHLLFSGTDRSDTDSSANRTSGRYVSVALVVFLETGAVHTVNGLQVASPTALFCGRFSQEATDISLHCKEIMNTISCPLLRSRSQVIKLPVLAVCSHKISLH